jgi:hypothetical protein
MALQDSFFRSQQTRYQELEPNRVVPNSIAEPLGDKIYKGAMDALAIFDPYNNTTVNPFSADGIKSIFQGTPTDVPELQRCRQYSGLSGLEQLIRDTEDNPNAPLRCGWRYKKSPDGICPQVSQGALGSRTGPLDTTSALDALGNGVQWIWDLKDARKLLLTDAAREIKTAEALKVADSVCNGDYKGRIGYCLPSMKAVPIQNGKVMYPTDPLLTCPQDKLITDPNRIPPPSATTNATASFQQVAIRELANCADTGKNPSLTRDCLLQAVKNNGCSPQGTLFTALQAVDPNQTRWDSVLRSQSAFQAFQSKQGDNGFTEKLFQRGMADWNQAVREVSRLQTVAQTSADPQSRVSAQDLCTQRGAFDSYDFCADVSESEAIGSVDLKCIQRYWEQENGKPAGLLYPKTKQISNQLGTINTFGDYKAAVRRLKALTASEDPIIQRRAVNNFLGVRVSGTVFSPLNAASAELDESPPCLGLGVPSPDRSTRLYTKAECDTLGGNHFPSGQCLMKTGGSYSWDCRYLNNQASTPIAMWLDAMDASTLVIDGRSAVRSWRDKSGKAIELVQNERLLRPLYTRTGGQPGIEFQGTNQFMLIPNASSLVRNQFTIFVVERRKRGGDNYFMAGSPPVVNANLHLGYRSDTVATMAFFGNDIDVNVPSFQGTVEPARIWCFMKPSGPKVMYINGQQMNFGYNNPSPMTSWEGAALGRWSNNRFYQGVLYEVVFYNDALNEEARQKMEGYLANKWGLTGSLPDNHPFKSKSP